jgi:hypothetical protein
MLAGVLSKVHRRQTRDEEDDGAKEGAVGDGTGTDGDGGTAGGAAAAQRLAALAYQLHLPVEGVVRVCEEVCRRLEHNAHGADAKGGGSGSGPGPVDAPKAPADSGGGVNDALLAKPDDKGHK